MKLIKENNSLSKFLLFVFVSTVYLLIQASTLKVVPDRLEWDKSKKNKKELNEFLESPLDLQTFKKTKKNRSNSGGETPYNYFFKPNYTGFYYSYFIFDNRGMHGPRITTYKVGKEIGGYMDTSEVFIQLSCDDVDNDLGRANLLSNSFQEIQNKFGDNYLKKDKTLIYQHKNTLLIISHSLKYSWFKIVKLNKSFNNYSEISKEKDLLKY